MYVLGAGIVKSNPGYCRGGVFKEKEIANDLLAMQINYKLLLIYV